MKKGRIYLEIGDCLVAEMPYSEVCMHMKVAGKLMIVERLSNSAQLYEAIEVDGKTTFGNRFSFPITLGEAGLFYETEGGFKVYGYGEKL